MSELLTMGAFCFVLCGLWLLIEILYHLVRGVEQYCLRWERRTIARRRRKEKE